MQSNGYHLDEIERKNENDIIQQPKPNADDGVKQNIDDKNVFIKQQTIVIKSDDENESNEKQNEDNEIMHGKEVEMMKEDNEEHIEYQHMLDQQPQSTNEDKVDQNEENNHQTKIKENDETDDD